MNYKQLTRKERFFISLHYKKGTMQEIANMLDRSKSTITREIKRNSIGGIYVFDKAHDLSVKRSYNKYSMKFAKYQMFNTLFKQYFDKRKSGVETTGWFIKDKHKELKGDFPMPSLRLVYYWVNTGRGIITREDTLRRKYRKGGKRIGGYYKHDQRKYVLPLGRRPNKVNLREEFGHGEIDLVLGLKSKGHSALLTLTERKTRRLFIERVGSKNPGEINKVLNRLIIDNRIPIRSITMDNGFEFGNLGLVARKHNFKAYVCEPFASHQRGTNERINGDIRRGYPKGTDFNDVSNYHLAKLEEDINSMKRHIFELDTAESKYWNEVEEYNLANKPNGFLRKKYFKPFRIYKNKSYTHGV